MPDTAIFKNWNVFGSIVEATRRSTGHKRHDNNSQIFLTSVLHDQH